MYGNLSIPMLCVTSDHTLLMVIIEIYKKKKKSVKFNITLQACAPDRLHLDRDFIAR